jgi:hypothetical protein
VVVAEEVAGNVVPCQVDMEVDCKPRPQQAEGATVVDRWTMSPALVSQHLSP